MNLLEMIMSAQGGGAVQQMGQQFGLNQEQTQSAISALLPALAGAMQQNVQREGGLEGLLGALQNGSHSRYLDDPNALLSPEGVQDGNGILGHLLGSKDVSRQLASHAAEQTGIGSNVLKAMLPMVAGLLMGGVSKQASSSGLLGQVLGAAAGMGGGDGGLLGAVAGMLGGGASHAPPASGGLLDMLGPLLGGGSQPQQQQEQPSPLNDILGMAARILTQKS